MGFSRLSGHGCRARLAAVGGRQRLGQGHALHRCDPNVGKQGQPGGERHRRDPPTGQVFNPDTSAFVVHDKKGHSGASLFIFDTENGTIDGWNPAVGAQGSTPSTVTEVAHNRGAKAVYKGLALAQASNGKPYLYATNFHSGRIEVYNRAFKRVSLRGGHFVDPYLPAGYGRSASPRSAANCM